MVPTKLPTATVRVDWTDRDGDPCMGVFIGRDAQAAQDMALAFVARASRDTAYRLTHVR